jgi:hypothetical protein
MSLKRQFLIVGLLLLLSQVLYPCNIVMIGGYRPVPAVRELSGTISGSARWDLMGHDHDEERSAIRVAGATISVKARTDTAFLKKGEIKYPRGMKHSSGMLKEWKCGSEVATVTTDHAGNFETVPRNPGKYCLEITGPQPEALDECSSAVSSGKECTRMHQTFLIDVVRAAPKTFLLADISQQWPDCSGGGSLKLIAVK